MNRLRYVGVRGRRVGVVNLTGAERALARRLQNTRQAAGWSRLGDHELNKYLTAKITARGWNPQRLTLAQANEIARTAGVPEEQRAQFTVAHVAAVTGEDLDYSAFRERGISSSELIERSCDYLERREEHQRQVAWYQQQQQEQEQQAEPEREPEAERGTFNDAEGHEARREAERVALEEKVEATHEALDIAGPEFQESLVEDAQDEASTMAFDGEVELD